MKRKPLPIRRAYANLLCHDHEYGNNEYVDAAMEELARYLGQRECRRIQGEIDEEYAGSGMETDEE